MLWRDLPHRSPSAVSPRPSKRYPASADGNICQTTYHVIADCETTVAEIHPLAVVSREAVLGQGVTIGPFCIVEPGVRVGDRCRLESHVVVKSETTMGDDNYLFEGAVVGSVPQHLKITGKGGHLTIGDGNLIREQATIHRALCEGETTRIGSNSLIMVNVHVAHDCLVGDHVVIANNVLMAGHITIEDHAYLSGAVAIHQFCRIGAYAMVGGPARLTKDVPPYVTVDGASSQIVGLNLIGIRRHGFGDEEIAQLKAAYRIIYRSGLKWTDVLVALKREFTDGPAADFYPFFASGKRGFIPERRTPRGATLKLPARDVYGAAREIKIAS